MSNSSVLQEETYETSLTINMPCEIGESLWQIYNGRPRECAFWGIQKYKGINKGVTSMYLKVLDVETPPGKKSTSESPMTLVQVPLSEYGKSVFASKDQAAMHSNRN